MSRHGDGKRLAYPEEAALARKCKIIRKWAQAMEYHQIANVHGMTVAGVRDVIAKELRTLYYARGQWKKAEMRCRALALELRMLRLGIECPEDQPIETLSLDPESTNVKAFKKVGVETVNQLRCVDNTTLMEDARFPMTALKWAVLRLDALGLSHRLKVPKRIKTSHLSRGMTKRQDREDYFARAGKFRRAEKGAA